MKKFFVQILCLLVLMLTSCANPDDAETLPDTGEADASVQQAVETELSKDTEPQDIAAGYAEKVTEQFSLALPDGAVLSLDAPYTSASGMLEYFFDGDGMTTNDYLRHAYEDYSLIVGSDYYSIENKEYIDYLRTSIGGAKTSRKVAVGDSVSTVLAAYSENLLYVPSDVTQTWRISSDEDVPVYNEPEIDCDYALSWRPYEAEINNECRDITFYIKDEKVVAIELISPFELRYVYGFDAELSDRVIAEKRMALMK